jgi:hypothetical protein
MNLRTLIVLFAFLSATLNLFPRVSAAGLTVPTGALIVTAEVLAAVVLIVAAVRACSGLGLRPGKAGFAS